MKKDLVVGVDCSTTASKAVVWDMHGQPVSEGRKTFPLLNPYPAWWEQEAEEWWEATADALRQATSTVEPGRIAALCLTHQRETFVPVDERGKPLRNAIPWMDERSRPQVAQMENLYGEEKIHRLTGKPVSMTPSVYKIIWMKEHEPALFERVYKYLDVHAYLVFQMTGQFKTGWGCADPLGVFDMQNFCWAEDLLAALGLRLDQFPEAFPPGAVLGEVVDEAAAQCGLPAGLPVVAGLGDGQAAGLGANITGPGQAYLNLGTAVVSGAYSESYATDRAFRTMGGGIPRTYLLETDLKWGTYIINWFVDKFGAVEPQLNLSAEEILEAAARKLPAGSMGLMLVPYWGDVMNPYWDPAAGGIIVGWRGSHERPHLYRAILEGIAFEQRLATTGVEEAAGFTIDGYVVMGGGSKSPLWCQIVADVTGKAVTVGQSAEATCLGAAILAASAAGLYPGIRQAAAAMVHLGQTYQPHGKTGLIYDRLFEEVYRHLFPALRPYLDRLTALTYGEGD